jgi:hypothetical protein
MDDYRKTRQALMDAAAPLIGCSVVIGFTVSPLLRFADPARFAISGGVLGLCLIATYMIAFSDFREPWWSFICYGTAAAALVAIWTLYDAGDAARVNDRRCLAIQRDMLSAHPRRTDGPDLFQALGCRPQGEGSVYAPVRKG